MKLTISLISKQQIASFFMDTINSSHSFATGGTSANEFWYNFYVTDLLTSIVYRQLFQKELMHLTAFQDLSKAFSWDSEY